MNKTPELQAFLKAPFAPEAIQWRVQGKKNKQDKALAVPYVEARTVMDRLDESVAKGLATRWYNITALHYSAKMVDCQTTLVIEVDPGLYNGVAQFQYSDVGSGTEAKGASSDALKRAAVGLGIARYIYKFPKQWVLVEEHGVMLYIQRDELPRLRKVAQQYSAALETPQPESEQEKIEKGERAIQNLVTRLTQSDKKDQLEGLFAKLGYQPGQSKDLEHLRRVFQGLKQLAA